MTDKFERYGELLRKIFMGVMPALMYRNLTEEQLNNFCEDGVITNDECSTLIEQIKSGNRREKMLSQVYFEKIRPFLNNMVAEKYKKELSEVIEQRSYTWHLPGLARELLVVEKLRTYQKEHNLSDNEMVDLLGVSLGAYNGWMRYGATPYYDKCVELLEKIGINMEEMIGRRVEQSMTMSIVGFTNNEHKCYRCDNIKNECFVLQSKDKGIQTYMCKDCGYETLEVVVKYYREVENNV